MLVVNDCGVGAAKKVVVEAVAFTLVSDSAQPSTYYIDALTSTGQWVGIYQSTDVKEAQRILDVLASALSEGCKVVRIRDETECVVGKADAKEIGQLPHS